MSARQNLCNGMRLPGKKHQRLRWMDWLIRTQLLAMVLITHEFQLSMTRKQKSCMPYQLERGDRYVDFDISLYGRHCGNTLRSEVWKYMTNHWRFMVHHGTSLHNTRSICFIGPLDNPTPSVVLSEFSQPNFPHAFSPM